MAMQPYIATQLCGRCNMWQSFREFGHCGGFEVSRRVDFKSQCSPREAYKDWCKVATGISLSPTAFCHAMMSPWRSKSDN